MITQEQVDKFIEEATAQIKEIDAEFEKTKRFIADNQGNFTRSPEIEAKAQELLAQAKQKAELAGRERAFDQRNAVQVSAPHARRTRGLAI